jgi:hypothetical protein
MVENALLLSTTLWRTTKPTMSTLELVKNGWISVFSQFPQSLPCLPFSSIWIARVKKNSGKKPKKQRNEQFWTLIYTLVFQTMSSPLSFFFLVWTNCFPYKIIPFKLNHNLICFGPRPLFKDLKTNLKFLTNWNVQFHWTLFLGPMSKVAFNPIVELTSIDWNWTYLNSNSMQWHLIFSYWFFFPIIWLVDHHW